MPEQLDQNGELSVGEPLTENTVTFHMGHQFPNEVLKLSPDGFYYKGEQIDDAGEARELFVNWLHKAQENGPVDLFGMVAAFHQKFGLEPTQFPDFPIEEIWKLKNKHMQEELDEIRAAAINGDLEEYFDGLIDLIYVALGAAYLAGLPFNQGFRRVHEANMTKVRALRQEDSKRGSTYDIVKPAGFVAPTLTDLIRKEKE